MNNKKKFFCVISIICIISSFIFLHMGKESVSIIDTCSMVSEEFIYTMKTGDVSKKVEKYSQFTILEEENIICKQDNYYAFKLKEVKKSSLGQYQLVYSNNYNDEKFLTLLVFDFTVSKTGKIETFYVTIKGYNPYL